MRLSRSYRGTGSGVPLLLLVAARGGNIPTQHWIDDHHFDITAIHADFYDPTQPLPPHALVVNAIGDADLCAIALARADDVLARSAAPVINPPSWCGQQAVPNARRLAQVPGVIAPRTMAVPRATILAADGLSFPLLLRVRAFILVGISATWRTALHWHRGLRTCLANRCSPSSISMRAGRTDGAQIPGDVYRRCSLPVAWRSRLTGRCAVHCRNGDKCRAPGRRAWLPGQYARGLGERAMVALAGIAATLGLDYGGVDFALAPDGSVLLFEANATMVICPPEPDPISDYRRGAIGDAPRAAKQMLLRHAVRRWFHLLVASPAVQSRDVPRVSCWGRAPLTQAASGEAWRSATQPD